MIIHSCTVAIISNGTPPPLDPPTIVSICLNTVATDQWAVFSESAKRSDKGSHTQLLLNRIYAPRGAEGWSLKDVQRSNNNPAAAVAEQKGKDQEDESKTIYALRSQINGLKSQWKGRKSMQKWLKKEKNWEAERGLRPSRGREIEFHIGK